MKKGRTQKAKDERCLTVYLFNVGQGDHMLLELPNGEYGIIDFFYGSGLAAPPALGYLEELRRQRGRGKSKTPIVLSFICLSHPDYDHVKGVETLLDWVEDKKNGVQLNNLWMWSGTITQELAREFKNFGNSAEPSHVTARATEVGFQLQRLLDFRDGLLRKRGGARRKKTRVTSLKGVGRVASNADGLEAVALAPLDEHILKFDRQARSDFVALASDSEQDPTAQQNLISSILMLVYGGHRLLFGGDTGGKVWRDCLDYYADTGQEKAHGPFKGSFVKASHHGSKHSSAPELWPDILTPGAHIGISAGAKNSYGHPHSDTLKHIYTAFRKTSDRPKIYATNSCHDCIHENRLPTRNRMPVERLDWVLAKRPTHPTLEKPVDDSFKHFRWKAPRRRQKKSPPLESCALKDSHEPLAAYIFRFKPGGEVEVSKGVCSALSCAEEECRYSDESDKGAQIFPQCAVPKR